MVRVLVDAHVFDEGYFQGTTSYIKGIYKENTTVDITFAARDVSKITDIFGFGVKTERLYFKSRIGRLLFDFPRLFLSGKYDLVHFQYIASPFLFKNSIVTIHDVLFKDYKHYFQGAQWRFKDILYRISYTHCKHVLTVSDYSKERLRTHYGVREVSVTENMFKRDTDISINPGIHTKFVLLVSRDEERKRLDLVEHLVSLRADLHFVVVTNSGRFVDCPQVTTYSKLEQSQLNWLYENCHFSIFPSMCEGFGMPVIESLLSGRMVLARRESAVATLRIPESCFFADDKDLISKSLNLWEKSFNENEISFHEYGDWTVPQNILYKLISQ